VANHEALNQSCLKVIVAFETFVAETASSLQVVAANLAVSHVDQRII
jgi:hypothetical protein